MPPTTPPIKPQKIRQTLQRTPHLPQKITPQNLLRRRPILHRNRETLTQKNFQLP